MSEKLNRQSIKGWLEKRPGWTLKKDSLVKEFEFKSFRDTIVFVEVKARRSGRYGHPKFAVTPAKQRHLSIAALSYLKKTGNTGARARFDVVTVRYTGDMPTVEHFQNAFELAYG